jgi:hypothetical protein
MDEIRCRVSGKTRDDARVSRMDDCISGDDPFDRKIDAADASLDVCKATLLNFHTER